MNNRLEILILNRSAEIYTSYQDILSVMSFLNRTGRVNNFSIVAHKGPRALFIDKLEPATLVKTLTEFQNHPWKGAALLVGGVLSFLTSMLTYFNITIC
jgi:hypothetical protein